MEKPDCENCRGCDNQNRCGKDKLGLRVVNLLSAGKDDGHVSQIMEAMAKRAEKIGRLTPR